MKALVIGDKMLNIHDFNLVRLQSRRRQSRRSPMLCNSQNVCLVPHRSRRSQLCLYILTFFFVLSGMMDVAVAAQQVNYDDNIGFIKDASQLRDEFPICDEFLNVEWFHRIPKVKPYDDQWFGKTLVDLYEDDRKIRRALMATMDCDGDKCHRATIHLIEVEQYHDKELEEQIRKACEIRRWYCPTYDCDVSDFSSLGFVLYSGEKERLNPSAFLKDPDKCFYKKTEMWISTTPLGAVGRGLDGIYYKIRHKRNVRHKGGGVGLTIGHLKKNICILSPAGNEVGIMEPAMPFAYDPPKADPELKKKFENVDSALDNVFPLFISTLPEQERKKYSVSWRNGMKRNLKKRCILLDVDGDNRSDLDYRIGSSYFFINDPHPFYMLSDGYTRPNKQLSNSMVDSAGIKSLQKFIAQEKERFKLRLKHSMQK